MVSKILPAITQAAFFRRNSEVKSPLNNNHSTKDTSSGWLKPSSIVGIALLGGLIPYQASSNCAQANEIRAIATESSSMSQEDKQFLKEVEDKLYQSHQN